MLAKIPKIRDKKSSSFKKIIAYQARAEDSDVIAKNSDDDILSMDGDVILSVGDITCYHNCISLDQSFIEMSLVARKNSRVEDPVYPMVISWKEDENPTDEEVRDASLFVLDNMGFKGHQYVISIHRDTDNVHAHIVVNRVHPETYKAVEKYNDYYRLDYIMRELELKYNWQHDNGPYVVNYDGDKPVIQRNKRYGEQDRDVPRLPDNISLMDRGVGVESFLSYARKYVKKNKIHMAQGENVGDWQSLHRLLSKAGIGLKPSGQGAVMYDLKNPELCVKASSVGRRFSKAALELEFGAFMPPVTFDGSKEYYQRNRINPRDESVRAEQRAKRQKARQDLLLRYRDERKQFQAENKHTFKSDEYDAIMQWAKQAKADIKSSVRDYNRRMMLYGVVAFEKQKKINALNVLRKDEMRSRKANPAYRFPSYQEWVHNRAKIGDSSALSQVRGWEYAKKRREKRQVRSNNGLAPRSKI